MTQAGEEGRGEGGPWWLHACFLRCWHSSPSADFSSASGRPCPAAPSPPYANEAYANEPTVDVTHIALEKKTRRCNEWNITKFRGRFFFVIYLRRFHLNIYANEVYANEGMLTSPMSLSNKNQSVLLLDPIVKMWLKYHRGEQIHCSLTISFGVVSPLNLCKLAPFK